MSAEQYPDRLIQARGEFKTGGQFQSMVDRRAVTEATETARVNQWRGEDGELVPCVCVYLSVDDIPDGVREVAEHHGMELVDREREKLVFVEGEDRE